MLQQNALYVQLSLNFYCVQEDLKVVSKWYVSRHKIVQEIA